jgi:hypothetical protein
MWFQETREFPSPCKYNELSFVELNWQLDLVAPCLYNMEDPMHEPWHSVWVFPHCYMTNVICVACIYIPLPPSLAIKSSTIQHLRSSDNTPLDTATLLENPLRVAAVRQPSRVALCTVKWCDQTDVWQQQHTRSHKRCYYMPPLYLRKHPESPASQAHSQPKPQAVKGPFPRISRPGKHADWDAAAPKPELHLLETYLPASPWS